MLPRNSIDLIRRVMARFGLDAGQYLTIIPNSGTHTHLPIDEPAPLLGVLASCVELQDVADPRRHRDPRPLHRRPGAAGRAAGLAGDDEASQARYREQVFAPNRSVLDLLEQFPACALPFAVYLDMLPPLRPALLLDLLVAAGRARRSAASPSGVLRGPARSGTGTFTGVGSGHLAAAAGATARCSRSSASRPSRSGRRRTRTSPMIMVGAGTGLAPFRGFLQERAALRDQGVPVAASLLFFGCRNQEADLLYADELRDYERPRPGPGGERVLPRPPTRRCRYVQDAMLDCADEVWDLLQHGRRRLRLRQRRHDRAGRAQRR